MCASFLCKTLKVPFYDRYKTVSKSRGKRISPSLLGPCPGPLRPEAPPVLSPSLPSGRSGGVLLSPASCFTWHQVYTDRNPVESKTSNKAARTKVLCSPTFQFSQF